MKQEELEQLKDRFRKWSKIKPRPVMIRLIVALDLAYKRIKELEDEKRNASSYTAQRRSKNL